ncbi:MAG: hypothetical protein WCB46_08105 [Methanoregula sp.]
MPEGEYGAGEGKIRGDGTFVPLVRDEDRIEVVLHGRDLAGKYNLIRFRNGGENAWLIVKSRAV